MPNSHLKNQLPDMAPLIHQAALDPHLNSKELKQICDASIHFSFSGLCTNLTRLQLARQYLGKPNKTKLIAVIAFPFGAIPTSLKRTEAEWAVSQGAEELDVVPDFFCLSQKKTEIFAEELALICEIGIPVRVILDIANLPKEELSLAIEASIEAGVSGIQSGNGFGPKTSTTDIQQLVELIRGRCPIKAAGGIRTLNQALQLIEAGAKQLGTSMGPELIKDLRRLDK